MTTDNNFEKTLSGLNPRVAAKFKIASEHKAEILRTPSLGLNLSIGGLRYGGFTVLWGNRACGKSVFALQQVAEAQREGKSCAWLDVEKNFSEAWASRLGVDCSKLLLTDRIISIAEMADAVKDLILSGIDVIVVDSISQLLPQSYFEDPKKEDGEIKSLSGTGQIGTFSKNIGQAVNIINGVNENSQVIFISQVRNNFGQHHTSKEMMGGHALEHAASTIIKFWRAKSSIIEREVQVTDNLLLKQPVGSTVTWTVEKNRGPGMQHSDEYDLITKGSTVGIDLASEVANFGVKFGVVNKKGNWFYLGDESFNGKNKFCEHLSANPELLRELADRVIEASNG